MAKALNKCFGSEVKVAVLGPECSYTDLACAEFLPEVTRFQYQSITKVFQAVATRQIDYGLVPLENFLNGLVGETLDGLRTHAGIVDIVDSTQLEVNHYIGLCNSSHTELGKISTIYSHPQALEQSRDFIQANCPQAKLISCHSTSEATLKLIGDDLHVAAIASKQALELQDAKILSRTTTIFNATRFILVKRKETLNIENARSHISSDFITSILIHPGTDRKGLLLEVLSIISGQFGANLSAIHSRPDGLGGFVFYLELSLKDTQGQLQNLTRTLKEYCSRETGGRAHISILGTYHRAPFFTPKINSIAIIGSEGAMGKWFNNFFTQLGFKVIPIDLKSSVKQLEELKCASVVVFSVPMHAMESASKQYKPYISDDSLIVENCSVKNKSIQCLINHFPNVAEILGIHTMFGPSIESIKRENVIITRTPSSSVLSDEFEQIFYKAGALTHQGSVEEHDNCVSIVQALVQYSSIVLANTLLAKVDNIEKLKPYLTPNSRSVLASIERLLQQSPNLLFDIQDQNIESKTLRHNFTEASIEINRSLISVKEFHEVMTKLQHILGPKLDGLK